MSTDSLGKSSLQVKSTTNFTASKKILSSQTFQIHPSTMNNSTTSQNGQNPIYSTKVNNFMKQFSNQPSSKFNTTSSNSIYDQKQTKQSNITNTLQDDNGKCKDELKEYKKLQEKLSYLETKILNIKTNIDSNNQKQAEQQVKLDKQQNQQFSNNCKTQNQLSSAQPAYGLSQTQNISSYTFNQTTSQFSSTMQTGRIDSKQNLQEVERENVLNTQSTQDIPSQQIINIYSQTIAEDRNTEKSIVTPKTQSELGCEAEIGQIPQQQQQILSVNQSPLQQKSNGGLSNFITQVNQGANIPFNFSKSKGEINSTKSSTTQLQIIKPSSTQHSLKKQNTFNSSMNKSTQSSSVKTPKQSQITQQQPSSTTNSSSSQYKSFAFKSGQNSYSLQHQAQKNAAAQQQLGYQNNNIQNNENEKPEMHRQSIQSMKNSTIQNHLNAQQSPYIQPKQQKLYYVSSIINGYQKIGDNSTLLVLAREHLIQTMQSIQFTKFIQAPSLQQIESKKVFFNPLKDNKKTLIFDLDETLIHCNENVNIPSDIIVPIVFPTGEVIEAGINIRPYAVQILEELSKIYEIVIFTASHSCYANVVLDYLDPQNQYISYRLYREHCVQTEDGVYVKDLRVIGNRNMSDMIIVDNAAYSFGFQVDNGLPIIPFYDNKQDKELNIQYVRDFREINKKLLKIGQYPDYVDPQELIEALYSDLLNA